jgi:FAD synthase
VSVETFLLGEVAAQKLPGPGARIEVEFLAFVRDEKKFESPVALKTRILRDVTLAKRFHAKTHVG